jgi:hypothetical protein
MALSLSKPTYRCKPIRSVSALARALRLDVTTLIDAANAANLNYRVVPPKPGSTRQIFDALGLLKDIHRRIKLTIFDQVMFPSYLHGSLKGCDYVTNASLHTNKKLLICEDVKQFFPSVGLTFVEDVWCGFFGFSSDVASLLTKLTTKDGTLPQGAITSSFLANLVLWRDEPLLHAKLATRGITYSRYVDDMAMSSVNYMSKVDQTWAIAQLYGMLRRNGLKAGRTKHEIFSSSEPMIATKLIVNRKPALEQKKRSQVRSQVRQLEIAHADGTDTEIVRSLTVKASQRVGQLGRFHKTQADHLKNRIGAVREALPQLSAVSITTYPIGYKANTLNRPGFRGGQLV